MHQTELNRTKLKARVRQRDEGLPELAEDVERLARLVYPDAPASMIEDKLLPSVSHRQPPRRLPLSKREEAEMAIQDAHPRSDRTCSQPMVIAGGASHYKEEALAQESLLNVME